MIDYDSLPNRFGNECLAAIETVNQEISGDEGDRWFALGFDNSNGPALEIYFDWNSQRAQDIRNSPVFRSYIAGPLLEDCPINNISAYGLGPGEASEIDVWFKYKIVDGELVDVGVCETTTYPVFCDEL